MADRPVRVAMAGTFDLENFGDVLFPLVAEHELGRRLGALEIVPYAYNAMAPPTWPYDVRPLGALRSELAGYDLLLVGGGHIIRGDTTLADGYRPSEPGVHHPLGIWLVPTLAAAAAGVPVAWNAVGVHSTVPDWAGPLVAAAAASVTHLGVRDESSAAILAELAPDAAVRIVPDTAFGAGSLVGPEQLGALRERAGLNGQPYVVVQPSIMLRDHRDAVIGAVEAARRAGHTVLELPIGPILGDATGLLELPGATAVVDPWPFPRELASALAGAEAVIADSVDAGVIAVLSGVPVFRPSMAPAPAQGVLDGFPGVHRLDDPDLEQLIGRGAPDPALRPVLARLDAHWDAVAAAARAPRVPAEPTSRLLADLPGILEAGHARDASVARERDRAAEFEAGYQAFRDVADERSAELRAMRREHEGRASELARLRERAHTLDLVEAGGWWRLRGRLEPLLRLAGAVKRRF